MNLCSDKHEEICYEGRLCPACAIIEDLENELEDYKTQLTKADQHAQDLQAELDTPSTE